MVEKSDLKITIINANAKVFKLSIMIFINLFFHIEIVTNVTA